MKIDACLAAACLSLCASCTTTADFSDTSAPTMTFRYRVNDTLWTEVTSRTEITIVEGDVVHMWAVGQDSGGVQSTVISGAGSVYCEVASGMEMKEDITQVTSHTEDASVGDGDRTESSRNHTASYSTDDFEDACTSGTFQSGSISFEGIALNFAFGSTSSPKVVIEYEK